MVPFPIYMLVLFLMTKNPGYGYQDTLFQGQSLTWDSKPLYSANKTFLLRFFSLYPSKNKYLGIFYLIPNDPSLGYNTTLVWIANRNNPVPDKSGILALAIDTEDGLLKISYAGGTLAISNNRPATPPIGGNISATLLDNGNFVLKKHNSDGSMNSTLWQSFDYPTDTLLPGMKIGINFRTGHKWSLASWTSRKLPATGMFTLSTDSNGTGKLIVWRNETVYRTSGLFRDGRFDNLLLPGCYNFSYISNEDEKYFMYTLNCDGIGSIALGLNYFGGIDFGEKTNPEACNKGLDKFWFPRRDVFVDGESFKFSEDLNLSLSECQAKCMEACSCVAFASVTEDGTGCELWSKLSYVKSDVLEASRRRTLYTSQGGTAPKKKWKKWLIIICVVGAAFLSSTILFYFIVKRRKLKVLTGKMRQRGVILKQLVTTCSMPSKRLNADEKAIQVFSLDNIAKATDNFSDANKLGEGGFGSVYKGKLPDGQDIAVKRRSTHSDQGFLEFKNEVLLIAKLQHINLVRLLGSCIQGPEKILVYEYMPNKSLDHFLFECDKIGSLKWSVRMAIIEGIAQGLLYLHKHSRLKVVHRDIKAGNILLDHNMNPKISDFGMARIFEAQESEANTKRIVGTYGYMSPEYIISGVVSLKTDVFSFGVLLLEIISGKKNRNNYDINRPLNLVGLAWKLWDEGRAMDVADSTMHDHLSHKNEVIKCLNIGLLCVQDNPIDRPSMMNVVSMLTNLSVYPSIPKRPAFSIDCIQETGNILKPHS